MSNSKEFHSEIDPGDDENKRDENPEGIIPEDLAEMEDVMGQSQELPPEPKAATAAKSNAVILYEVSLDCGVSVFRDADTASILVRFPIQGRHAICGLRDSRFVAWMTRKFYLTQLTEPKRNDIEGASRLLEALAWEQQPVKICKRQIVRHLLRQSIKL